MSGPPDSVDEFGASYGILARLPAGLPDPGGDIDDLPEAVKAYRAYVAQSPQDGGAWEGLGYLYLRMHSEEASSAGLSTEDLGDPPDTNYAALNYAAEKRACELRPTNRALRRGLNTCLGNALSPYQTGGPAANPLIEALGGAGAAQAEYLALIEDTLRLFDRRTPPGRERLAWEVDYAGLLESMGEWAAALRAWEVVAAQLGDWKKEDRYDWPTLATPRSVHLSLYACALQLGDLPRAAAELETAQSHSKKPLNHQRYALLRASGDDKAARALAEAEAAAALRQNEQTPEDAYLLQAADWWEKAGRLSHAEDALRQILSGTGYGQETARKELERLQGMN